MIREVIGIEETSTRIQRWSHALTLLMALGLLAYGLNVRSSIQNAITTYSNPAAGVRVNYPANWLIDDNGDYVFRVQDATRVGFNTAIQVATRPVGRSSSERNIRDQLIIERTNFLIGYQSFSSQPITLPDESTGMRTEFVYVDAQIDPFSETVLTPVRAVDVITLRGGQAIIITFRADARTFSEDFRIFERFLNSLELF